MSRNADTLRFYAHNAASYVSRTVGLGMSSTAEPFLALLPAGSRILDAGCGSGRDTRYFRERGYEVIPLDGSPEIAQLASNWLGTPVTVCPFQELSYVEQFEGIWACASLLHLEDDELADTICRLFRAMRKQGILYASFKAGNSVRFEDGRLFQDMDIFRFRALIEPVGGELLHAYESPDTLGRGQAWWNFIVRRP